MTTGKDKEKVKVPFKDAGMIGEEETKVSYDPALAKSKDVSDEELLAEEGRKALIERIDARQAKRKEEAARDNYLKRKFGSGAFGGTGSSGYGNLGKAIKDTTKTGTDIKTPEDTMTDEEARQLSGRTGLFGFRPFGSSENEEQDKQIEQDFRILSSSDSGDPKFQQALGRIKGLLGGKGSVQGIREVDWTPVDDNLKAVDKANALYKKLMELNTNMLGAPSPAIVEKLRGMIPDNLIRGVKTELPQIEQLKYDKAEAMTRVAVTSALSGMFQTLRGSSGSLPTAGAQGFTQGINAIQKREDQIANMNAAIDQKNAEIANQYFKNEQDFATAYNNKFTELEQARNTAVKTYFEEQNKLYGKMMDVIGKAYGATVKEAEGEQKSQRTDRAEREKEIGRRDRKRAELAVQMDKNNIERAKAYWQIEKASREQNYMTQKEWLNSTALLEAQGVPPEFSGMLASTKHMKKLTPEQEYLVKSQTDLLSQGLKGAYDGFLWTDNKEGVRAFNATVFPLLYTGFLFRDQSTINTIQEKVSGGAPIEFGTDIFDADLSLDANRYPETMKFFNDGKIVQGVEVDKKYHYVKAAQMIKYLAQMEQVFLKKGDQKGANKVAKNIKVLVDKMGIGGINRVRDMSRDTTQEIGRRVFINMSKSNKNMFEDSYNMVKKDD